MCDQQESYSREFMIDHCSFSFAMDEELKV